MKGNETFKVAVKTMEEAVREVLTFNQRTIEDVNVFVPHQANIRILKAVAQRLKFPIEKTVVNLDRFGNTSAASIPLALDEAVRTGTNSFWQSCLVSRFWSRINLGLRINSLVIKIVVS